MGQTWHTKAEQPWRVEWQPAPAPPIPRSKPAGPPPDADALQPRHQGKKEP